MTENPTPSTTPAPARSEASAQPYYGERFEPVLIIILSLLIVASFLGVAWIWHTYQPECRAMEYTYCPSPEEVSGSYHSDDDHH